MRARVFHFPGGAKKKKRSGRRRRAARDGPREKLDEVCNNYLQGHVLLFFPRNSRPPNLPWKPSSSLFVDESLIQLIPVRDIQTCGPLIL